VKQAKRTSLLPDVIHCGEGQIAGKTGTRFPDMTDTDLTGSCTNGMDFTSWTNSTALRL